MKLPAKLSVLHSFKLCYDGSDLDPSWYIIVSSGGWGGVFSNPSSESPRIWRVAWWGLPQPHHPFNITGQPHKNTTNFLLLQATITVAQWARLLVLNSWLLRNGEKKSIRLLGWFIDICPGFPASCVAGLNGYLMAQLFLLTIAAVSVLLVLCCYFIVLISLF